MSWNYISSVYKGYAVSNSMMISIESGGIILPRLLVSRLNVLEFFTVGSNGIELDFQIELFANVTKMEKIVTDIKDAASFLFILSENLDYGIVTVKNRQLITKIASSVPTDSHVINDAEEIRITQDFTRSGSTVLQFYLGLYALSGILNVFVLKLINKNDITIDKIFNVRLPFEKIIDLGSLHNHNFKTSTPLIAILSEPDHRDRKKSFKVMELNLLNSELLAKSPVWEINFIHDLTVNKFQCSTDGSVLFFSEISISLYEQGSNIPVSELQIAARIDIVAESVPSLDLFFALENKEDGEMYLVSKNKESKSQEIWTDKKTPSQQLKIKYLGKVPLARTATYLGSSMVFVGSERDNSYLFLVADEHTGNRDLPYLIVLENLLNLGFISDLKLIKRESNSNASLLTASYQKKAQQVNILRSGINFKIQRTFELHSVKDCWLIPGNEETLFFVSASNTTLSFRIDHQKFKFYKNSIPNFEETVSTISINELGSGLFVQITPKGTGLFQIQELKTECLIPSESGFFDQYGPLVLCAVFEKVLYLITKEKTLITMNCAKKSFEILAAKNLEKQVSAVSASKNFLFLSFWREQQVLVLDRETLIKVHSIDCGKDGIVAIHSSCLSTEHGLYLFVGFFDGLVQLHQYTFMKDGKENNFEVLDKKSYKIGSQPIFLQEHTVKEKIHVLASCDNSASFFIKEQNQISYSNILNDSIKKILPWRPYREDGYLILMDRQIAVGYAEFHDKLQARTLPFESQYEINFILPLLDHNLYAAGINNIGDEMSFVKFYDSNCYVEVDSIRYEDIEVSNLLYFEYDEFKGVLVSLITKLGGRVEVYEISDYKVHRKQSLNFEKEVLLLSRLSNRYVVVALPNALVVLQMEKYSKDASDSFGQEIYSFTEVLSRPGHSQIWQMQSHNNHLLIIDSVKGLHLYWFNAEDKKLILVSRSAINSPGSEIGCIIDENWFLLVSENTLRILKKNLSADSDFEKMILQQKASIHLPEVTTCIVKDKKVLIDRHSLQKFNLDYALFAGINGSINLMAVLPEKLFIFLNELQKLILQRLPRGFGNDYSRWRSSKDLRTQELLEPKGFIDGDVLKRLLKMSNSEIEEIDAKMPKLERPSLHDIVLMVEELDKVV